MRLHGGVMHSWGALQLLNSADLRVDIVTTVTRMRSLRAGGDARHQALGSSFRKEPLKSGREVVTSAARKGGFP